MSSEHLISFAFLIISVILYIVYLWQEKRKIYVYRFFALRDKLCRAAIEERIDEKSLTYLNLSFMINMTIAFSKKFKFTDFMKTLKQEKKEPNNRLLLDDIKKQSPEIIEIAESFFHTFIDLLIINNPILFLLIKTLYVIKRISRQIKILRKIFPFSNPYPAGVEVYSSFKLAEEALKPAT